MKGQRAALIVACWPVPKDASRAKALVGAEEPALPELGCNKALHCHPL